MRKILIACVGVLFIATAAHSGAFEQQLLQSSQIAGAAARQTREAYPAKIQKAALQESAWYRITGPDGSFTAEMPTVPKYIESQAETSWGSTFTVRNYNGEDSARTFHIQAMILPQDVDVMLPNQFLFDTLNERLKDFKGLKWDDYVWKTQKPFTPGLTSIEIVGRDTISDLRICVMINGHQMIFVMYLGPDGTARSEEANRFFSSVVIR